MIRINTETCIGCGLCAADCVAKYLKIVDGKAVTLPNYCIGCGHCYAICPTGSITLDNEFYKDSELNETEDIRSFDPVSADTLLYLFKSRRSVRRFTDQDVESQKIRYLLDAVRYAPTGRNTQHTRITLIKDQLPELTQMSVNTLAQFAEQLPENASEELTYMASLYKEGWKGMKRALDNKGKDLLFHHCNTLMIISAPDDVDGAIAASYAELMCHSLGLGCVYIGFMKLAAEDPEIRKFLKLKKDYRIVCTLAIGYSAVTYRYTVPRKERKLTIL